MGSKKSPAPVAPQPVTTQTQQKPVEPIKRAATDMEARDRADANSSAELLAPAEDDSTKKAAGASLLS